jgi:hypothetical protein
MNTRAIEDFFRDFMFPISAIGTIAGAILTFIGVAGVFLDGQDWVKDNAVFEAIGDIDLMFLIFGGLLLVVCVFYLYDHLMTKKKFEEYTNTASKSKILHNFDEIDKLAYKLGSSYLITWRDIKRKHKIRR